MNNNNNNNKDTIREQIKEYLSHYHIEEFIIGYSIKCIDHDIIKIFENRIDSFKMPNIEHGIYDKQQVERAILSTLALVKEMLKN